jgi:NAD(P)-dependent dehydrogenase (short-subunit alcohol dehydrogenase family)
MRKRAALVTGRSSGIGLAISRALAREGFNQTVVARDEDKLRAAVGELQQAGHRAEAFAGDLVDESAVRDAVARHTAAFGWLDLLVNNAGTPIQAPIAELATDELDPQLRLNLRTPILLYREAADLLQRAGAEHGQALVINIASLAARGEPNFAAYAAAKAGVLSLTRSINREWADAGVRSTALTPGTVNTPATDFLKDQFPPEDMIQPEDLAEAVRFLVRTSKRCVVSEIVFAAPGEVVPV